MFEGFGKISRLLSMPMLITEKIDGINAQVFIEHKVNVLFKSLFEGDDPLKGMMM